MASATVSSIVFSRLSDEEILKYAPTEVSRPIGNVNVTRENTIYDPKMGVCDRDKRCLTCAGNSVDCVGGYGHIKLAQPYYQPVHGKLIVNLLEGRCVKCFQRTKTGGICDAGKCGGTVVRIVERKSEGFVNECYDTVAKKTVPASEVKAFCNRLGLAEDSISIDDLSGRCWKCMKPTSVRCCGQMPKKLTEIRVPADCWEVEFFDKVSLRSVSPKEVYDLLQNLARVTNNPNPLRIMNKYAIVTPICTRPYFPRSNHELQSDTSIIYNTLLRNKKRDVDDWRSMQKEVYIKMEMLQTQKKKRPLQNSNNVPKSIKDFVQGKPEWINAKINGRRVNHASRAVISPYPDGTLGYVGIPRRMAAKNTVPVYLKSIGDVHTMVGRAMVEDYLLKYKPLRLIKRHPDGENSEIYRLLNPTIIKNLLDNIKRGEHCWVERPLRDGDVVLTNRQPSLRPESIQANRVKILPDGLDGERSTIGLVLCVTGSFNADFDGDEMNVHVPQDIRACVEAILLLPPSELIISAQKGTAIIYPVQDCILGLDTLSSLTYMKPSFIRDLAVQLDIDVIEFAERVADWLVVNENKSWYCGMFATSLFIDREFSYTLDQDGVKFCIVEGSIDMSRTNSPLNADILRSGVKSIAHQYVFSLSKNATCAFYDRLQMGTHFFLATHGFTIGAMDCIARKKVRLPDKFDPSTVLGLMENRCRGIEETSLEKLIRSGAKASMTNAVQIKQVVGQQNVDGCDLLSEMRSRRMLAYYNPQNDTLMLPGRGFDGRGDDDVVSHGFIRESFSEGLKKSSTKLHCKAGWRGVGDSVTKVADTGYTTKKLTKNLENLTVAYDLTVRDMETNRIVQFLTGGDGMNPARLPAERVGSEYRKVYFTTSELKRVGITCRGKFTRTMTAIPIGLCQPTTGFRFRGTKMAPILNLKNTIIQQCQLPECAECTAYCYYKAVDERLVVVLGGMLSSRVFQPGTAIGLVTGTNFGEITSQLLLKSFHHSGIKTKNISGGIKRLTQLLNRTNKFAKENVVSCKISNPVYEMIRSAYRNSTGNVKKAVKCLLEQCASRLASSCRRAPLSKIVASDTISACGDYACSIFSCHHEKRDNFTLTYTLQPDALDSVCIYDLAVKWPDLQFYGINIRCLVTPNVSLHEAVQLNREILARPLPVDDGPGYDRVDVFFDDAADDFEVVFRGVPLETVLLLPFVAQSTVVSNDIYENEEVFGVEAGRRALYDEIQSVLMFDGANIDPRFIDLIVDKLSFTGKITCIKNNSNSIVTNAFFEHEVKKWNAYSLTNAADPCESVESAIILGTPAKLGTRYFDIFDEVSGERLV